MEGFNALLVRTNRIVYPSRLNFRHLRRELDVNGFGRHISSLGELLLLYWGSAKRVGENTQVNVGTVYRYYIMF